MDPSYIYYKEIEIDQDQTFTADFSKKPEIERVIFKKENEYAITGLSINSIMSDSELLKIENEKEQKIVSEKIKKLIEEYEEPDLTFVISNTETKTLEIPLKKMKLIYQKKPTYFDFETKSNKDFYVYGYIGHLKKFGFLWADTRISLVYEINVIGNKLRKMLMMSRNERKKLAIDETRAWNMKMTWQKNNSANDRSRINYSDSYLYDEHRIKTEFGINIDSFDFTTLSATQKSTKIVQFF